MISIYKENRIKNNVTKHISRKNVAENLRKKDISKFSSKYLLSFKTVNKDIPPSIR